MGEEHLNPSSRKTDWKISGHIVLFAKEWLGDIDLKTINFRYLVKDCICRNYSLEKMKNVINQIPMLEFLARKRGIVVINIPLIPSKKEFQRKKDYRFYESHGYFPRVQKYTKVKWIKGNNGYGYHAKVKKEERKQKTEEQENI